MPNLPGPTELIIILLIVMLVFGGAKLPKLARSLGEAKTEFEKSARKDAKSEAAKDARTDDDDRVTLSRAELDALLTEREQRAKRD